MTKMKATVIYNAGGPDVLKLEERPVPDVKPGWVLARSGLPGDQVSGAGMKWREMARMRRRAMRVFEFNCPYRGSEAAVGDETIIMIRLSGIG